MGFFRNIIQKLNDSLSEDLPDVTEYIRYARKSELLKFVRTSDYDGLFDFYLNADENERYMIMTSIFEEPNPVFFEQMDKFHPTNYLSYLFKGAFKTRQMMDVRGSGRVSTVSDEEWKEVFELGDQAYHILREAMEMKPDDVQIVLALLLVFTVTSDDREVTNSYLEHGLSVTNSHLAFYASVLNFKTKKWGGSYEDMFGFARSVCQSESVEPCMYSLIAMAHVERWLGFDFDEDYKPQEKYFSQQAVIEELINSHNEFKKTRIRNAFYYMASNYFACAFYLAGMKEQLKEELEFVEGNFVFKPWCYIDAEAGKPVLAAHRLTGVSL